jgi:hypothetical protein
VEELCGPRRSRSAWGKKYALTALSHKSVGGGAVCAIEAERLTRGPQVSVPEGTGLARAKSG